MPEQYDLEQIIYKKRQTIVYRRCDSYRIQTCNLLIRSQMLYSVELMSLLIYNVFFVTHTGFKPVTF